MFVELTKAVVLASFEELESLVEFASFAELLLELALSLAASEAVLLLSLGADAGSRSCSLDDFEVGPEVLSLTDSFALPSSTLNDGVGSEIGGALKDDGSFGAYSVSESEEDPVDSDFFEEG